MDWLRATSPLKLAEMTAFTLPLPSYFSIPAMANGFWLFPVTSTPSWANRYVPCSVALEHFAPASFSSSANPLPTATTPTTPTTPNTTNRAARYLFMRSLYLLVVFWQALYGRRCPTVMSTLSRLMSRFIRDNQQETGVRLMPTCAHEVCTDGGYLGGAKDHCERSRCQI